MAPAPFILREQAIGTHAHAHKTLKSAEKQTGAGWMGPTTSKRASDARSLPRGLDVPRPLLERRRPRGSVCFVCCLLLLRIKGLFGAG